MSRAVGTTAPLRVAMIGSRGVPATWGGIERHVEELGARLADRGHEVTVFCRTNYQSESGMYRGMRLRRLRTVGTKHLDAIVHSGASSLRVLGRRSDIVHFHGIGPSALSPLVRLGSSSGVVLTVHGLDHQRAKWGVGARTMLAGAAWVSEHVPHRVIAVSRALERHYSERGARVVHIPNGVVPPHGENGDEGILDELDLRGTTYLLYVGRLVPEKAPDTLIDAFRDVQGPTRLVLVGESRFMDDYSSLIREKAALDPRVCLAGYRFGSELRTLYERASAFVLPSLLEGLPLTMLEAISHALPIVASSIEPHLEILGGDGPGRRLCAPGDVPGLAAAITAILHDEDASAGAERLREEVLPRYDWDAVTDQTEDAYREALAARGQRTRGREVAPITGA